VPPLVARSPMTQKENTHKQKENTTTDKHITENKQKTNNYTIQNKQKLHQPTGLRLPTGEITSTSYPKVHFHTHHAPGSSGSRRSFPGPQEPVHPDHLGDL